MIWIEQNMLIRTEGGNAGRLEFKGGTQKIVHQKLMNNKHLGAQYDDVMELAIQYATEAVMAFKIKDSNSDWGDILIKDHPQYNKLWKSINLALKWKLSNIDPNVKRSFDSKTKTHVIIKPHISSIHEPQNNEEGEGESISDSLSDKNRLSILDDGAEKSELAKWFSEIVENVLSKKQLEFVDKYGTSITSDRSGYLSRIKKRLDAEMKKQNRDFDRSQLQKTIQPKLNVLKRLNQIVENDEDLSTQNSAATDWVNHHIEKPWVDELIFNALGRDKYKKLRLIQKKDQVLPGYILSEIYEATRHRTNCWEEKIQASEVVSIKSNQSPVRASKKTQAGIESPYKTLRKRLMTNGVLVESDD